MRSPGEVQQSAGAFGRGGSGSCFRGSGALRWLRGLHLGSQLLCSCFCSLFGLALGLTLLGAGHSLLLTLFGAQLDAADRTDAVRTVGRNGLAAFLAEGLGALIDTDRAKAGELAQLQAVQTAVGAGGNADPALAAYPRPTPVALWKDDSASYSERSISFASNIPCNSSNVTTKSTSLLTLLRIASSFLAAHGPMNTTFAFGCSFLIVRAVATIGVSS